VQHSLIARVLSDPAVVTSLGLADWDRLIREARASQLIGRLVWLLRDTELSDQLPDPIHDFLLAHEHLVDAQHEAVRYEACEILDALSELDQPIVFLKGSAYILTSCNAARGRLLGDIDIMVPASALREAELMLKVAGWNNSHYSREDQRYYRQWMHELPAMQHRTRGTVLDVHHTILPPTARASLDARRLFSNATPIENLPNGFVLSDEDMVIHCATHLFHEGEFEKGLRDLSDFALLLKAQSRSAEARNALTNRALELDLAWPLYLAMRYNRSVFGNEEGNSVMIALEGQVKPSRLTLAYFDAMFARAFMPHHPLYASTDVGIARWMLYVRSHWLRMPPHLLTRHLFRKGMLRLTQQHDRDKH